MTQDPRFPFDLSFEVQTTHAILVSRLQENGCSGLPHLTCEVKELEPNRNRVRIEGVLGGVQGLRQLYAALEATFSDYPDAAQSLIFTYPFTFGDEFINLLPWRAQADIFFVLLAVKGGRLGDPARRKVDQSIHDTWLKGLVSSRIDQLMMFGGFMAWYDETDKLAGGYLRQKYDDLMAAMRNALDTTPPAQPETARDVPRPRPRRTNEDRQREINEAGRLYDQESLTQFQITERLGKSESTVKRYLRQYRAQEAQKRDQK